MLKFNKNKKDQYINKILKNLKKGDIFIDCGANIGQETLPAANLGAIVFAFEPDPNAFNVLKKNSANYSNITIIAKAVGHQYGKFKLYFHQNADNDPVKWSTGSSILNFKSNINKEHFIEVEVIDLVEFIESLGKEIKVLKIDVEGAEPEIIEKIIESEVYKKIGKIFVETHEHKIPEIEDKILEIKAKIKNLKIKNIDLNWR